jgi:hypothetical protein
MAMVNLLRFSPTSGGIVADEGFWNVFFRRRNHGDNLHRLLTEEMAEDWGMEAVIGEVGYPSVHHETMGKVQEVLCSMHREGVRPEGVRGIARVVFEAMQEVVRKRIDQKMGFWFDFQSDDLVRGFYRKKGGEIPIRNAKVKEMCLDLSKGGKKDALLKAVFDVRASVFGYDSLYGITAFYLSPEKSICGYVHEGFDCVGSGKYASGLSLGLDFNAKTMMMRQDGYSPPEGLFELITASLLGIDHFKETGGTLNIMLLDSEAKTRAGRVREVFDEPARLCAEVVRAHLADLVERKRAIDLIDRIVFLGESLDRAEKALFTSASDPAALKYVLRGYKKNEAAQCAAGAKGAGKPAKAERGRKKKGA